MKTLAELNPDTDIGIVTDDDKPFHGYNKKENSTRVPIKGRPRKYNRENGANLQHLWRKNRLQKVRKLQP